MDAKNRIKKISLQAGFLESGELFKIYTINRNLYILLNKEKNTIREKMLCNFIAFLKYMARIKTPILRPLYILNYSVYKLKFCTHSIQGMGKQVMQNVVPKITDTWLCTFGQMLKRLISAHFI